MLTKELPSEYKKAFKSADIRGVYPSEIDEVVAYRVARAFIEQFGYKKMIVARDMRVSSPTLRQAFVAGVLDAGADVVDIGLVGTPAMYFASGSLNLPGVMITASHNPREYNGLKLVEPQGIPLTDKTGLNEIEKLVVAGRYKSVKRRGKLSKKSISAAYKKYLQQFTAIKTPRPINLVVDAGNGMATTLAPILEQGLPITVHPLFFELDGTFPNRDSNPTLIKNQKPIKAAIKKLQPDFGVAFDGDADRIAFFDERGRYINSAVIGALIADLMLKRYPGEKYVYTNFTSRSYEEAVRAGGGTLKRAPVGHAFIKRLMRQHDARFACEHSAHFYFKSNYFTDSGIITLLRIAEVVGEGIAAGKTFSQIIKPFDRYYQTEEILVPVANKKLAMQAVKAAFTEPPQKSDMFDGLMMSYEDVWFTVKPSVTEDALKFVVESPQKSRAIEIQKKIKTILDSQ